MDVDGRDVEVTGSLLPPLTRRTSDIIRVVAAGAFLIFVIVSSVITRDSWVALEQSISDIVGVLTPTQSDLVYLVYGLAIVALPFTILLGLLASRQWRLLWAFAAAAAITMLVLSINQNGISAPRWHFDLDDRLQSVLSQFLDDPRWIGMLAAVLTVSGPWLPARWRRWWWILLLAFVPIHLVVSSVVPARAVLGLATGWFVGALVVLVVGTPALLVPLADAVRALAHRGVAVSALTVLRPAGAGPLTMQARVSPVTVDGERTETLVVDLSGPNQRSAGALRQFWRRIRLRTNETAPLQLSVHRAVEHRGLVTMAVAQLGLANADTLVVAPLARGWSMYAGSVPSGRPIDEATVVVDVDAVWRALKTLHDNGIAHGDLRSAQITVDAGEVRFGGFGYAEFGATEAQFQSDLAQLLVTTSNIFGAETTVTAAINVCGADAILTASRRLTKSAVPGRIRDSLRTKEILKVTRDEVRSQTGAEEIPVQTVTRFTRSQLIQLVLLGSLVYVAYPFISTAPTFFSELGTMDWWWALAGLIASLLTYVGAAAALWACADGLARMRDLIIMQFANTFAATTTPAGVGGLALSTRFLQKAGLGGVRATTAVALQQAVQVIVHVALLILFTALAGASADLTHMVPSGTVLFLIGGLLLGIVGVVLFVPKLRHWLATAVRPKLTEVAGDLLEVAREPKRLAIITIGCGATTVGAAFALWASVHAFGGTTTFVTVTVVTMVGGTLASAAPTPGGVGAVEAALIGGLAAFGVPSVIAIPAVLLYRILTCWLPVIIGWPVMRWMTRKNML